jgi:hypothetical protein
MEVLWALQRHTQIGVNSDVIKQTRERGQVGLIMPSRYSEHDELKTPRHRPYALFGHSMGAWLAYEVAQARLLQYKGNSSQQYNQQLT